MWQALALLSATGIAPPTAAWQALGRATSSVILVERPVSLLRFCGEGRRTFLHGLCTANVKAMPQSAVLDAAVVDRAGNTVELMTVADLPIDASLLAIGTAGRGDEQQAFFDKYAFPADAVTVEDISDRYSCVELVGPSASSVLKCVLGADPPASRHAAAVRGGVCLGVGSLGYTTGAYTLLIERDADDGSEGRLAGELSAAVRSAGGASASWGSLRIIRGRPLPGNEYSTVARAKGGEGREGGAPSASPLELGLWSAVHLDKGCYMGQEVIARIARARRPRREIYGVQFDSAAVASLCPGTPLHLEAPEGEAASDAPTSSIGMLTSVLDATPGEEDAGALAPPDGLLCAPFALALVRASVAAIGTRVRVGDGRASGVLVELPHATRVGQQAGGAREVEDEAEGEPNDAAKLAKEAKQAEAERKAAKLAVMEARLKAFQERQKQSGK